MCYIDLKRYRKNVEMFFFDITYKTVVYCHSFIGNCKIFKITVGFMLLLHKFLDVRRIFYLKKYMVLV